MKNVIQLITDAQIRDMTNDFLKVQLKTRKDSIPLNGEKVLLDIKYLIGKKQGYFVRIFNIGFNSIEDLIKVIFHYTKHVDIDTVFKSISIKITREK